MAHWDAQIVQVYCPHGDLRVIVATEDFDRPLEDIALWWPERISEPAEDTKTQEKVQSGVGL